MRKRSQIGGQSFPLLSAIYLNDLENFMNTSGCRGIETDVQNNEFTVFIILFVIICQ